MVAYAPAIAYDSGQTENANPRKPLPVRLWVRSIHISHRRLASILHIVPDNSNDQYSVQCILQYIFANGQGIHFAAYELCSRVLNPRRTHNPFIHCISGGLAGAFAAALTNPLDVVKTLLQTRTTSKDPEVRSCNGFSDAVKVIYGRDGIMGFTKGIRPRVIQFFPSTAICWSVYEFFKHILYQNGGV